MSAPTPETERLSRFRNSAERLSVTTTQQRTAKLDPGKYELYASADCRFRQGGSTVGFAATPALPTVTPQGSTGATAYSYKAVEVDSEGKKSAIGAAGSTATGNAALSGSNFNRVTGACSQGAVLVEIWRTVGGATQGKVGVATPSANAYTFDDTGLAGDGGTAPTTATSLGTILPARALRIVIVDGVATDDDDYITLMTESGSATVEYAKVT